MKNSNEKSLKVINESIFDKIKSFILKIFKKEQMQNIEKISNDGQISDANKTTNDIHISAVAASIARNQNKEEEQKELIKRIESEEIKTEEPKDEELEKIKADLSRYLGKIQKEIEKNTTKESI